MLGNVNKEGVSVLPTLFLPVALDPDSLTGN